MKTKSFEVVFDDAQVVTDGMYGENILFYATTFIPLEEGIYDITITYSAEEEGNYIDLFSYWQKQGAEIQYTEQFLNPEEETLTFSVELLNQVDDLQVRTYYGGEGELEIQDITITRNDSNLFTDYFCTGALLLLFFACFMKYCRKSFYKTIVCVAITVVSIPLLKEGIVLGWDMIFHVNRIEGIYQSIRAGSFPVRIQGSQFAGYGYAASIFYPDTFLYIPVFFRFMGMSLVGATKLFLLIINVATGSIAYYSVKKMYRNEMVASIAAVLYLFASYRVSSTYGTFAIGVISAAVFLPLVILGIYEVICGNKKKWYLLAIGATGVFQSHILCTVFVIIFAGPVFLICGYKIIKEKRFVSCLKAGAAVLLWNLWFLVPFLQFQKEELTVGLALGGMVGEGIKEILGLDFYSAWISDATEVVLMNSRSYLSIPMLVGIFLFVGCLFNKKIKIHNSIKVCFVVGIIALYVQSAYFPWTQCSELFPSITFLQFPVRLMMVTEVTFSIVVAYVFYKIAQGHKKRSKFITTVVLLVSMLMFLGIGVDYFEEESYLVAGQVVNSSLPQTEYIYPETDKDLLVAGQIASVGIEYGDYEKQATTISAYVYDTSIENAYLEVPLLYYPGYAATLNGERLAVVSGENNVLRVYFPQGAVGELEIWYRGFTLWNIANAISLISIIFSICAWIYAKKVKR
ncbi:MAG: hypothetical protein R3Y47_12500 [Lachnospiraceae bacterium]